MADVPQLPCTDRANTHPLPEPGALQDDVRLIGYARATAILVRPEGWSAEKFRAASKAIIRLTNDWLMVERAAALLRQLDREPALRGCA